MFKSGLLLGPDYAFPLIHWCSVLSAVARHLCEWSGARQQGEAEGICQGWKRAAEVLEGQPPRETQRPGRSGLASSL